MVLAVLFRRRFRILTAALNSLVAEVHYRMPVILRRADVSRWLDSSGGPAASARLGCRTAAMR